LSCCVYMEDCVSNCTPSEKVLFTCVCVCVGGRMRVLDTVNKHPDESQFCEMYRMYLRKPNWIIFTQT